MTRALNRNIGVFIPEFYLCTTPELFEKTTRSLKRKYPGAPFDTLGDWLRINSSATTHTLAGPATICVVTIDLSWIYEEHRDGRMAEGLLAHEAVHVVDAGFEHIGERTPSSELKAYAVQYCFVELLEEFDRQFPMFTRQLEAVA